MNHYRAISFFLRIVWRKWHGCRIGVKAAWSVAKLIHLKNE